MEAKQTDTSQTHEEYGGAREVLRGIAHRRLERAKNRAVRGVKNRARAFGRGARIGYAVQENPARAAAATFIVGLVLGAIGIGLYQVLGDFQTLVEEEMPEENPESAAA